MYSVVVTPFNAIPCRIVTKILSIIPHTSITEYILFSIKSILFFEKYTIDSIKEKNIAQIGNCKPSILSPIIILT